MNTFSIGTGHVDITFEGPGYPAQTWGNNITNGNWRVQEENLSLSRPDRTSSAPIELTYEQFSSMISFITGVVNGPNNNYGLAGLNCVDFIRDALEAAGLGNQVAGLLTQTGLGVNYYAYVTDWMQAHGLGFVADGIGQFFGNMGELANAIGDAAEWAYETAADAVGSAFTFVTGVAQSIMSWGAHAWSAFMTVFGNFGKELPGEQPEVVPPQGRPGPWSEVTEDSGDDEVPAMLALERFSDAKDAPYISSDELDSIETTTVNAPVWDGAMLKTFQPDAQAWAVA